MNAVIKLASFYVLTLLLFISNFTINCKQFALITSLYNEKNEKRRKEYLFCLKNNLTHPMINQVHILYDQSKDTPTNSFCDILKNIAKQSSNKLIVTKLMGRPSFSYCFELANKKYPDWSIILCNGDVFFNDTLSALQNYNLTDKLLALTRWNIVGKGSLNLNWLHDKQGKFRGDWAEFSQDAWIFDTPIRKIAGDTIMLGTWNCDSLIAYAIGKSGLQIFNPCLTIQCCHLHLTEIRHYVAIQAKGPFLALPWCKLNNPIIKTDQDDSITSVKRTIGYPIKIRVVND